MDSPLLFLATIPLFLLLLVLASPALRTGIRETWWGDEEEKKKQYHPALGSAFLMMLHFGHLYDYLTDLSRRHKTFRFVAPSYSEVLTSDPAVVEYILRTNFANYGKGWLSYDTMKDLFGDGIFTVDGGKWRQQRKLASFEFSTRTLRDFSGQIFKRNAAKLARAVSTAASSHQIIDVQDWFMKSTMDSIFEVAFGIKLNTLEGSNPEGNVFAKAFDDASSLISWRFVHPCWKLLRFLNIGFEAELKENIKLVDSFVYRLIHAKMAQLKTQRNDSSSVEKEDILSRFLLESEKDQTDLDQHRYLRDIILNFVIAGKDTTAVTLSWFFYMLCKHTSVQEKVAREVREAVKTAREDASFADFAECITEEALGNMQYLHAALSETLRLYPAVPVDSKVCFSDDVLPDGFHVRKGDAISYQAYAMGRMEYLWGKDAEVFRPERWFDADGVFCPESPFKFTAFQAGPRVCLGREFAYRQMKIFAAVALRFFSFKLSDEKKPVNYRTMLTLHIDQGLHLHAFKRS